jgi:uncharacterized protein
MIWVIFLFLVVILVIAIIWWLTYRVLFSPSREIIWTPHIEYQDLYLEIDDVSGRSYTLENKPKAPCINVWLIDKFPGSDVILYFHGNSGNISHRDYVVEICEKFKRNLLLVDYRGYGRSDGIPSSEGIHRDSITAYEFLRTKYESDRIIIWGESLGGSAAIYVASYRECKCLLLLSTFASLEDVIFNHNNSIILRLIGYGVRLIVNPIPSKEWIGNVNCPVAIMHSKEDELIPYCNSKILYDNVSHCNKMFLTIKGEHGEPEISEEQLKDLFEFASIDICLCTKEAICGVLENLRTVAQRHGIKR